MAKNEINLLEALPAGVYVHMIEGDLKKIGIPKGPRVKILHMLAERNQEDSMTVLQQRLESVEREKSVLQEHYEMNQAMISRRSSSRKGAPLTKGWSHGQSLSRRLRKATGFRFVELAILAARPERPDSTRLCLSRVLSVVPHCKR